MAGDVFQCRYRIRFEHCDYAGILFFPHYAVFLNRAVEDWFAGPLRCDFGELHAVRRLGIPTARLEFDMTAPSRLGDMLDWDLTVAEVRTSALVLHHRARSGEEERLRAVQRIVFAKLDGIAKTPIPDDLRPRIEAYVANR